VRENDLIFRGRLKCFTIETACIGRFLRDRSVRWIRRSRCAITAATNAKLLTVALVSCGARAA